MTSEIKERDVIDLMISELNSLAYDGKTGQVQDEKEDLQIIQDDNEALQEPHEEKSKVLDELIKATSEDVKKDSKDLEKKVSKGNIKESEKDEKENSPQILSPEQDYARHTELYKQFQNEYLKSTRVTKTAYEFYTSEESDKREFSWGEEIINYKERKELVRSIHMNALLQGGHNYVNPDAKERYEFWKYASKFNQMMSFLMYDTIGGGS